LWAAVLLLVYVDTHLRDCSQVRSSFHWVKLAERFLTRSTVSQSWKCFCQSLNSALVHVNCYKDSGTVKWPSRTVTISQPNCAFICADCHCWFNKGWNDATNHPSVIKNHTDVSMWLVTCYQQKFSQHDNLFSLYKGCYTCFVGWVEHISLKLADNFPWGISGMTFYMTDWLKFLGTYSPSNVITHLSLEPAPPNRWCTNRKPFKISSILW